MTVTTMPTPRTSATSPAAKPAAGVFLTRQKKRLMAKHDLIWAHIRALDIHSLDIEGGPGDDTDRAQRVQQMEEGIDDAQRKSALLWQIDVALVRLDVGSYTECEECSGKISRKRLKAEPWARLCIHCQERADGDVRDRYPMGPLAVPW